MTSSYRYEKLDQKEILQHLFQPTPSSAPVPEECEDMMIHVDDDCTLHLRAFGSEDKEEPVILFFHGNGEQVADYTDIAMQFNKQLGISFLAAEYRGYGLATGTPTATHMIEDCQVILDRALAWKEEHDYTGKFLVMGRSLGCVSAIELTHTRPKVIDSILIDSGFAFTIPVLEAIGANPTALGIKEEDCFRNLDKMREINKPFYAIHGANDELISIENVSNLVSETQTPQRELQLVPGATHNSLFADAGDMYYEVMGRFIKNIGVMRKKKSGVR